MQAFEAKSSAHKILPGLAENESTATKCRLLCFLNSRRTATVWENTGYISTLQRQAIFTFTTGRNRRAGECSLTSSGLLPTTGSDQSTWANRNSGPVAFSGTCVKRWDEKAEVLRETRSIPVKLCIRRALRPIPINVCLSRGHALFRAKIHFVSHSGRSPQCEVNYR